MKKRSKGAYEPYRSSSSLDDGAHRVVTQIVQREPNGDHGELNLVFWLDLAPG
jgi:hypothetical protein